MATINVAPGGNLTTAYNAAVNGDVIQLAAGSYGAWATPTGTKTVTIQGVGVTTLFTLITCNLANATFKNFRARCISDPSQFGGAQTANWHDTLWQDILIDGENRTAPISGTGYSTGAVAAEYAVLLHGTSLGARNTFRRVEIRNAVNAKGIQHPGLNHVFDDVNVHDISVNNTGRHESTGPSDPIPDRLVHNEGMYVLASPGLTLKNSTFLRCPTMDVFFTASADPADATTTNVTLENNVFGHTLDASGNWHVGNCVYIKLTTINGPGNGPINGWTVRNNLFEHGFGVEGDHTVSGSRWVGNIGQWDDLSADGMVYRYNVGTKIHATDTAVTPSQSSPSQPIPVGWVNPAAGDFHLTAGSVAIGKADPTDFPQFDKDGAARS